MAESTATADTDRFCVACGYNLRHLQSDRCPECGTAFDLQLSAAPQIPWCYRRSLGRRKAFWRTVWLATFRTKNFAREIDRPVSLPDALAFRRAVALHVWIPLAIAVTCLYVGGLELHQHPWFHDDAVGGLLEWLGLPVLLATIWFFLILSMGICSYFFHPRWLPARQQNRGVAMSYYACAPWAYLVFTLIGCAICGAVYNYAELYRGGRNILPLAIVVASLTLLIGGQLFLTLFLPHTLLRRMLHCGKARLICLDLFMPVAIALIAVLTIGVINAAYWWLAIVLESLVS